MSEALDRIRSRIEALGMGFQLIKPIQTKGNGVERETWLLDYEGAQFVFVPGQKQVTLGWDTGTCPLGPGVLEGLRKEFSLGHDYYYMDMMEDLKGEYQEQIAEAEQDGGSPAADRLRAALAEELEALEDEARERGLDSWDHHMDLWNRRLSQCLSPLRTADIGDMLVEADSRSLDEDAPSLDEAVRSLKKGPFTLATEDEWEYLCNGGARTLFRWGDTLEGVLSEIYAVGAVG